MRRRRSRSRRKEEEHQQQPWSFQGRWTRAMKLQRTGAEGGLEGLSRTAFGCVSSTNETWTMRRFPKYMYISSYYRETHTLWNLLELHPHYKTEPQSPPPFQSPPTPYGGLNPNAFLEYCNSTCPPPTALVCWPFKSCVGVSHSLRLAELFKSKQKLWL